MPDSLRDLLRQRAAESGGPAAGLAEGSLRKARGIARRRFAAVAVGAAAGLAIAGMAAGALILPDDGTAPPVDDPTSATTDGPEDPTTAATEELDEDSTTEETANCGRPGEDWSGWGDSDSIGPMTELPESLYVRLSSTQGSLIQVHRYDADGEHEFVLEHPTLTPSVAPDGNRYLSHLGMGCNTELGRLDGPEGESLTIGADTQYCAPIWSPDSNRVTLTVPGPAADERYLLDLATGEQTELPQEVSCEPRWSADGEYLVSQNVAIRPDGSGRVELEGLATWDEPDATAALSSISADLGRACLEEYEPEEIASGHIAPRYCDLYVDTATGQELELPVGAERPQVIFLPEGGMIVTDQVGDVLRVMLFDLDGNELDRRDLRLEPWENATLQGYFTD